MRSACAPGNRGGAGVSSNDMKGIAMKLPITYVLMAGALALAAATPAAFAATGDDAATSSNQATADYKAQLEKCKNASPTYQAPCKDAVGMRSAAPEDKTGTATPEMGSLQGRDKCARLSGDDQRDCLLNDKGG
jgi:hypothetical protein